MRAAEDEGGPGRAGRVVEGRGTGAGIQPTCTPGTRRPQDRVRSAEHLRPQPLPSCSVLDLHLQALRLASGVKVAPLPGGAGVSCNRQAFPTWPPTGSIRFTSDLVENSRDQTACQAYTIRKPQSGPYNLSLELSSVFI